MNASQQWDQDYSFRYRSVWLPDKYMDGDTFTVLCDHGHDNRHQVAVRLRGYSAAERYEVGGPEATAGLRAALGQAFGPWPVKLTSLQRVRSVTEVRSLERWVCDVQIALADGSLVNLLDLLP